MHNLFSALLLVLKRLWHNLGLSISALAGILSVLTLIVCVPVFSYAVSGELLRQELSQQSADLGRPPFSMRFYYLDLNSSLFSVDVSKVMAEYVSDRVSDLMGLQVDHVVTESRSPVFEMSPVSVGLYDKPGKPLAQLSFMSLDGLPAHARVIEGAWPAPDTSDAGPIKVAIQEGLADKMGLATGERYLLDDSIEIEIACVWRETDPRDPFWFNKPEFAFMDAVWVPEETYRARLDTTLDDSVGFVYWYVIMDERDLRFQHAQRYAQALLRLDTEFRDELKMDYSPLAALTAYQERAKALTTMLYAVSAPMAVLALFFIGLTSNIAIQQHRQEIAAMRSRGTSRFQVVTMNLMESLILIGIALPLSFVSGRYAANAMSKTLSFLKFTSRPPLFLSYAGANFFWVGVTVVFIGGARLIPALGALRRTIVKMKQERSRTITRPLWQRFYLDFLLLLPGAYAYLVLRGWATSNKLLAQLRSTGDLYRDPLLFVAPALFAMAVCMISLRLVPLVARALAAVVEKLPGVWLYLSLEQVARRLEDHASALLLIMISLSLAIFAASAANTLDQWLFDSVYYGTGADLTVRELLPDVGMYKPPPFQLFGEEGEAGSSGRSSTKEKTAAGLTSADLDMEESEWYPDLQQYLKLPGIEHVTRVGRYEGRFSFGRGELPCWVMGIERMSFPQVAFFRDDLAPASLGALMNALGAEPMGVLIPRHLTVEKGFDVGDRLVMDIRFEELDEDEKEFEQSAWVRELAIVGVYDYFPTVYPDERPTLIVNLEYVFGDPDAVTAYSVWLDLAENANVPFLVDGIHETLGVSVEVQGNALEAIERGQDQAERMGLFGVLNIGFLTAGLMPGLGFVLYSYASLRQRFIQLGILQALGLLVRQLVGYLVSEQLLLMGIAIAGGAAIGLATSYLFVPFLQSGISPEGQVPPFQVSIGWAEAGWLSVGFGVILFLTMLGTIAYLVRLKVFQAIKLGESL